MDWQILIPSVVSFISGFGLAITKGLSKVIEDVWMDHRNEKKRIKQRKNKIVSQLLFDIPKGKAANFEMTMVRRGEGEQIIAQISSYDKKMAKKISAYLNLWRHFASINAEFQRINEIIIIDENGDPESKGPDYLEQVSSELYDEYDGIIDLLNKWNK